MWPAILKFLGSGVVDSVGGIVKAVAGDKTQIEDNAHAEAMAARGQYAAEFRQIARRTWWDSFVDGLNRLPRPLMAFGMIALLTWPTYDALSFAAAMQGYALVPEWLGYVILAVVGFYFTSRHLEKARVGRGPSAAQVAEVLDAQRQIAAMRPPEPVDDEQYEAAMADTSKPLPNRVIEEWNRRRQSGR